MRRSLPREAQGVVPVQLWTRGERRTRQMLMLLSTRLGFNAV